MGIVGMCSLKRSILVVKMLVCLVSAEYRFSSLIYRVGEVKQWPHTEDGKEMYSQMERVATEVSCGRRAYADSCTNEFYAGEE